MAFQTLVLVFTICVVLVITSAGNFKVSAAAQQYEARTLESGCPNINNLEEVKSELIQDIGRLTEQLVVTEQPIIRQTTIQNTESSTSGQTTEQSMSTTTDPIYTCNDTPGWRRVVFINMTDTSYDCPPGLSLTSYSKRTCGRAHTNGQHCSSTTFSVGGSEYSRVCGRIRGYQVGATCAFYAFSAYSESIESYYVDGVSLTNGPVGGRQHIWSFASGLTEITFPPYPNCQCPCDNTSTGVSSPPFVGNDYFCESGLHSPWPGGSANGVPFLDDPLWDGQNCTSTSTCCQLNNPPWFTKILPNPTTDDIELRLCSLNLIRDRNVALEIIELYVQ